jgi:hypothetical protein
MSAHAMFELPLPTWGEGWGEGVTALSRDVTPSPPALSPNGERASDRGKSHHGVSIHPALAAAVGKT